MNNVYIVDCTETTIDEVGVLHTEHSLCDFAYADESKAIEKVTELAKEKMTECVDELGYNEDDVDSTTNENGDYQSVTCGSNTYEYKVLMLGMI